MAQKLGHSGEPFNNDDGGDGHEGDEDEDGDGVGSDKGW